MRRVVGPGFHEQVFAVVRTVPVGTVVSYGQIAEALGAAQVARHVGFAMAAVDNAKVAVPWHRVVNARGEVSRRANGQPSVEQRERLEHEGVMFRPNGTVDMRRFRHTLVRADDDVGLDDPLAPDS